jgi:hypothetical protein
MDDASVCCLFVVFVSKALLEQQGLLIPLK